MNHHDTPSPTPIGALELLLCTLQPHLHPGCWAYVAVPPEADWRAVQPVATMREAEGLSAIVAEAEAQRLGWPVAFRCAWLTLDVRSELQAVGLTAAVSSALREAGIACNVVAGLHHDHLFVPVERADAALACLQALQQRAREASLRAAPSATGGLHCVVYVSTAVAPMDERELETLLLEARALNLETHTTGVLLYSEGNFMQYFEGSAEAVALTYERIRASRRHRNLIELLAEPIAARHFEDWQMGCARPASAVLLALSSAVWSRQAALSAQGSARSPGLELLLSFWKSAGG